MQIQYLQNLKYQDKKDIIIYKGQQLTDFVNTTKYCPFSFSQKEQKYKKKQNKTKTFKVWVPLHLQI